MRTWQCPFGAGYEPSHRRAVTGSRSGAYYKSLIEYVKEYVFALTAPTFAKNG